MCSPPLRLLQVILIAITGKLWFPTLMKAVSGERIDIKV